MALIRSSKMTLRSFSTTLCSARPCGRTGTQKDRPMLGAMAPLMAFKSLAQVPVADLHHRQAGAAEAIRFRQRMHRYYPVSLLRLRCDRAWKSSSGQAPQRHRPHQVPAQGRRSHTNVVNDEDTRSRKWRQQSSRGLLRKDLPVALWGC